MRKNFITIGLLLFLPFYFVRCQKDVRKWDEVKSDVEFVAFHFDTLNSNEINKVKFEYKNKEFERSGKRYLDVYYTIQDSPFTGELMDLEKQKFGILENARTTDTIKIDVFGEKGNKYVTFFVYDEIQKPVTKDSINMKYVVTKFVAKTFIK